MSRRPEIRLTPEEQAQFVREHNKAALATIDRDGFPHVVAMNCVVKDGVFYMTSYGKAQKVVNIRRNPRVGLMVETGSSYGELRGVMVRGRCQIIEGAQAVEATFALMDEVRGRGERSSGAEASAGKRVVLKIVPEKVVSWDHRKLAGRY